MEWYLKPIKRLWLDVDGPLADFEPHFLSYLKLPSHPATDWNDPRFRDNFHRIAEDEEFWLSMPRTISPQSLTYPIAGYCTARPCSSEITKEWLARNGFPSAPVVTVGMHGAKEKVLHKYGCDVFVDDAFHNFVDINRYGITCYLLTRNHNKMYKEVTDLRVPSVADVIRILKNEDSEHEGGS